MIYFTFRLIFSSPKCILAISKNGYLFSLLQQRDISEIVSEIEGGASLKETKGIQIEEN